jgi:putative transposase
MLTFSIGKGLVCYRGQSPYQFARQLPDGRYQFEQMNTGEYETYTQSEFLQAYVEKKVTMTPVVRLPCPVPHKKMVLPEGKKLFPMLPEKKRERALRRIGYVKAVLKAGVWAKPTQSAAAVQRADSEVGIPMKVARVRGGGSVALNDAITAHAEVIGDPKRPCVNAVRGWVDQVLREGMVPMSLIDHPESRRVADLGPTIEGLIERTIDEVYLTRQKLRISVAYSVLVTAIERLNKDVAPGYELKTPSKRTFERRVGRLPKFLVCYRREGPDAARMKFRSVTGELPYATRILECVQLDHTVLNALIYDDDWKLPLGRPHLTAAWDQNSGNVVGFYVTFSKPSLEAVLGCIGHSILPKSYLKERYPSIKGEFPCYGKAEMYLCDNAFEFHSNVLKAFGDALGTDIAFHAKKSAWLKGGVERFMASVNTELMEQMPGTTFGSPEKRGDYKSEKQAVMRFETLIMLLHKWVIEVNSQRGIGLFEKARIDVWNDGAKECPPFLPCDPEEIRMLLCERKTRQLTHDGISLHCLKYNSDEATRIRENFGSDIDVEVLYDRRDLGSVYIRIPKSAQMIKLPCLDPRYAEGLSLMMHRLVRRHKKRLNRVKDREQLIHRSEAEILWMIRMELESAKLQVRTKLGQSAGINSEATIAGQRSSIHVCVNADAIPSGPTYQDAVRPPRLLEMEIST